MELKYRYTFRPLFQSGRSNRTFMELKCIKGVAGLLGLGGSNRTFMELKLIRKSRVRTQHQVLIVPLWN